MSKNKLNIILIIFAAVLLIVALFQRHGQKKYTVDDFKGQTYQTVINWMEENSVPSSNVVFDYHYSDTVPENTVISQSIAANRTVSGNNSLIVTVSKGEDPGKKVVLIDFSEMDQAAITAWLDENRIEEYQFSTVIDDDLKEGTFISSDPAAGTRIKRDTPVIITMSIHDPSPTVALPDFTGMKREEIQAWADKYGISVNYIYYYDASEQETFLYSDIPAGTQVDKGGRISIAISNGSGG